MHLPQPMMGSEPWAMALRGLIPATFQYGHCDLSSTP